MTAVIARAASALAVAVSLTRTPKGSPSAADPIRHRSSTEAQIRRLSNMPLRSTIRFLHGD
jgi:hypothetical protein